LGNAHFEALNGFSGAGTSKETLVIYNPVYASPQYRSVILLGGKGITKDGVFVEAVFPDSRTDHACEAPRTLVTALVQGRCRSPIAL
jgi:hypothetical protein